MIPGTVKGKCFACGKEGPTELHHIFEGSNRKCSDGDGLTVYLCKECHTGQYGAHGKDGLDLRAWLHEVGQNYYEMNLIRLGLGHEEARKEFIKNYTRSYRA